MSNKILKNKDWTKKYRLTVVNVWMLFEALQMFAGPSKISY